MKFAIFGNSYQKERSAQIQRLFQALYKHGSEIWICADFFRFLTEEMKFQPIVDGIIVDNCFDADIALSIGGDGTFLRTAERVGKKGIPILGINTGRLGFLADISSNDLEDTITEVFKNYYRIEERTLLQIGSDGLPADFYPYALNEIAVSKRDTSSMIAIHTFINDDYLTTYQADGLIVATPTGSTAYSLSVGGPIIEPQSDNFVLTAVAPHSLNVRPLVISNRCRIRLETESRSDNYLISVDGHSTMMKSGPSLFIEQAPFKIKVVKRYNHLFYNTLRNKLMWGTDKRL